MRTCEQPSTFALVLHVHVQNPAAMATFGVQSLAVQDAGGPSPYQQPQPMDYLVELLGPEAAAQAKATGGYQSRVHISSPKLLSWMQCPRSEVYQGQCDA